MYLKQTLIQIFSLNLSFVNQKINNSLIATKLKNISERISTQKKNKIVINELYRKYHELLYVTNDEIDNLIEKFMNHFNLTDIDFEDFKLI